MSEERNRVLGLKRTSKMLVQETENWDAVTSHVLEEVVVATMKKYQAKINVGVQDSTSSFIDAFKQSIAKSVFESSNQWRTANKIKPMIYPKGCRFCYSRGNSTIVVIEQDAQVRSLDFEMSMHSGRDSTLSTRAALSLPYVLFFFHFREDRFVNVYCGWSKSPIQSLDNLVCVPLLPNIHGNLSVCLGGMRPLTGDVSNQISDIISHFWNSQFNGDLANEWNGKKLIDTRLTSTGSWERNSLEDPLFILGLDFKTHCTVGEMIDKITVEEESLDEARFRQKLAEEIDGCTSKLFEKMMTYFEKQNFSKYHPKKIKTELAGAITESVKDIVEVVKDIDCELEDLSDRINSQHANVVPVSSNWGTYQK